MVENHVVKIEWTPVYSSGGSVVTGTLRELTNVVNVQIVEALGKSADSFSIKVYDPDDYYFNNIASKHLMKVYSSVDGGLTWKLEIDGVVRSTTKAKNFDNNFLTISGLNRLELVLGFITPVVSRAGQLESPDYWIRQIIREVNTQNGSADYSGSGNEPTSVEIKDPTKYIKGGLLSEWVAVGNDVITGYYTDTTFYQGDENAFELIERLSSPEYCGVLHYFYLDTDNYFRWVPYTTSVDYSMSGDAVNTKITKQEFDGYNYVIIKAGKNLYETAGIVDFKYDLIRATESGIKAKVLYLEGIRRTVVTELTRQLKNLGYYDEEVAPFSTTYPFRTPSSWHNSREVSSDSELNSDFVDEVLYRAGRAANDFLSLKTKTGYSINYDLSPFDNQQSFFLLGDYVNEPTTGANVRVSKRTKVFNLKRGWVTSVVLEEDVDKL